MVFKIIKQKGAKAPELLNHAYISLHQHAQNTGITMHLVSYADYFTGCTGFGTARLRF
jgi:hypothetical protein